MCRAFESLPGKTLEKYFGPREDGKPYTNLGLNIIPPVLQGLSLGPSVRKLFSQDLEISTDPDINKWPRFRYEYGKQADRSKIHFQRPLMKSSELHDRFQDAVQHLSLKKSLCGSEPLPHPTSSNVELLQRLREDLGSTSLPWALPNGNLEALVGFVLDDFWQEKPDHLSYTKISIPSQLQDIGWNTTNSLIWAANPILRDLTKMSQSFRSVQESEKKTFIRFNQSILQHSGLRVVLMCGHAVQNFVVPMKRQETCLKLDAGEFPVFLDLDRETIQRVYILIPNPADAFLFREWRKTHKISEILHFTSAITKTPAIRPYAGDSSCVLTSAIRNIMDERTGAQESLTLENLHPMTRLWLARRGVVKDEDISLLQELGGGSLSNSVFVLLHVAPSHVQNAPTTASMSSFHRSSDRHAPNFYIDKAHLEAIGELCEQLSKRLLVDLYHPAIDSIQEAISRESALECDVGEAEVAEREDL